VRVYDSDSINLDAVVPRFSSAHDDAEESWVSAFDRFAQARLKKLQTHGMSCGGKTTHVQHHDRLLSQVDASGCAALTESDLAPLAGLPLESLNLARCWNFEASALKHPGVHTVLCCVGGPAYQWVSSTAAAVQLHAPLLSPAACEDECTAAGSSALQRHICAAKT
jgi:hypothetical protein